jgi:hypothetical protein
MPLDRWAQSHDAVADLASGYYVVMHFGMVSLALLLLWIDGRHYRRQRDVLFLLSLVGLCVYWAYPAAPPRLLPGVHDTVAAVLPLAGAAERSGADQFASMPSLHVAWAVWAAVALASLTTRRLVKGLLALHPLLTTVVVLMTGNHYVIDVLAGASLAGLSFATTAAWHAAAAAVRRRRACAAIIAPARPRLLPPASPARVSRSGRVLGQGVEVGAARRSLAVVGQDVGDRARLTGG